MSQADPDAEQSNLRDRGANAGTKRNEIEQCRNLNHLFKMSKFFFLFFFIYFRFFFIRFLFVFFFFLLCCSIA